MLWGLKHSVGKIHPHGLQEQLQRCLSCWGPCDLCQWGQIPTTKAGGNPALQGVTLPAQHCCPCTPTWEVSGEEFYKVCRLPAVTGRPAAAYAEHGWGFGAGEGARKGEGWAFERGNEDRGFKD